MKKGQFPGLTCEPGDQGETCSCTQKDYLIAEEEDALAMLRQIKEKVKVEKTRIKELKEHLKSEFEENEEKQPFGAPPSLEEMRGELNACEQRLAQLKAQWDEWDKRRKDATREKLVRLGHG